MTLLLHLVTITSACDIYNTTYSGSKAKIMQLPSSSTAIKRTVYGNVKVLDGCRFEISNFTMIPSGLGVYFYAVPSKPPTDEDPPYLARVVQQGLSAYNGQTIDFSLAQNFNWSDFAVVMIWSEQDRQVYAAFGVTQHVKDIFQLPSDVGANLQLDPNANTASRTTSMSQWNLLGSMIITIFNIFT